jgi:hypothetical protein
LRRNLFVSGSLEIFQQPEQMLRYGLACDLVEQCPDVPADMSL